MGLPGSSQTQGLRYRRALGLSVPRPQARQEGSSARQWAEAADIPRDARLEEQVGLWQHMVFHQWAPRI